MKGLRPARVIVWYLAVALTLTAVAGVLYWQVAPSTGLVRTFYDETGFAGEASFQERTADIDLGFLHDNPELPRESFSVHWSGFWFLPEAQTVDLHADGDLVELLVDRRVVLRRTSAEGTTSETVALSAGPHELIVRYEPLGTPPSLTVRQAPSGETPRDFAPTQLFPGQPDAGDYRFATRMHWFIRLVAAVWLVPLLPACLVLGVRSEVRAWTPQTTREFARKVSRMAVPALLGPVVLFLVGPHTIYEANRNEFSVAFADIAWPWLVAAVGIGWLLLFAVGAAICLLSDRLCRAYVALLLAFGMLLWIQGTFLVADFGPLYGERLDLSRLAWRGPYESGLWVGGVLLVLGYARAVSAIAPLASGLFVVLQVSGLAVSMSGATDQAQTSATWRQPPEQLYQLSRNQNVVHIVLDGFLSQIFAEASEQNRARFDREFSGFVFFADHLGAFPTTRASMPAMLAGVAYRNEMPFDEFLRNTTHRQSISTVLAERGYAIHSLTFDDRDHPRTSGEGGQSIVRYRIPTPYGSYRDYVRVAALQLFDLSLFRHVPQGLKSSVYNDQVWLAQNYYRQRSLQSEAARAVRPSNHAAFLEEFTGRLTVALGEPVFTFIHVAIPHPPIAVNADCSFLGYQPLSNATYTAQAQCALLVVQHLLDRLRSLGVYDESVVVLASDHGWRVRRSEHPFRGISSPAGDMEERVLSAMPLLAIKPAAASGPLRISYAPTEITDVPATIVDLLGLRNPFPGKPALQLDANVPRIRNFAHHSWENADWERPYLDALELFSIDGRVLEPSSWTFQGTLFDPSVDSEAGLNEPQAP